jgi:hypothetical protein
MPRQGIHSTGDSAQAILSPMKLAVTDIENDEQIIIAKLAYAAYGESTGFKNFQGNQMPAWDDLGTPIQNAWIAAGNAVSEYLMGPQADDDDELSPGLTD